MNTQPNQTASTIQEYSLRPGRYVNIDGSFELGWGMMLFLFALSHYLTIVFPRPSIWTKGLGALLFICAALGPMLAPKAIKRFITWPRTGYVAFRRGKVFWIAIITGAFVSAVVSLWIVRREMPEFRAKAGILAAPTPQGAGVSVPSPGQEAVLAALISLIVAVFATYWVLRLRKRNRAEPDAVQPDHGGPQGPAWMKPSFAALLSRLFAGTIKQMTWAFVLLMLVGVPLVLGAGIFGLACLDEAIVHPGAISLRRAENLTLFAGSNAILYLMGMASHLKEHPWKLPWCALLVLGSMAIGIFLPDNFSAGAQPIMLFLGIAWLASGAATLFSYLRRTRQRPFPGMGAT